MEASDDFTAKARGIIHLSPRGVSWRGSSVDALETLKSKTFSAKCDINRHRTHCQLIASPMATNEIAPGACRDSQFSLRQNPKGKLYCVYPLCHLPVLSAVTLFKKAPADPPATEMLQHRVWCAVSFCKHMTVSGQDSLCHGSHFMDLKALGILATEGNNNFGSMQTPKRWHIGPGMSSRLELFVCVAQDAADSIELKNGEFARHTSKTLLPKKHAYWSASCSPVILVERKV